MGRKEDEPERGAFAGARRAARAKLIPLGEWGRRIRVRSIFSIDVEDWYHILDVPSAPDISRWDGLPARVEANFGRLLDILDESKSRATCFFVGYIAQRFPALVREARARGHEIASHSFAHRLVYSMTPAEFLEDAARSR